MSATTSYSPYTLNQDEHEWLVIYHKILEQGYQLPLRYRPSWSGSSLPEKSLIDPILYEDAFARKWTSDFACMDATKLADGCRVFLKIVKNNVEAENEVSIIRFLSSPELRSDPCNHFVPLLDAFEIGNSMTILVFPYLSTDFHFRWVMPLEALPQVRKSLEGLVSMHEHNVAHRDIHFYNCLLDAAPLFGENGNRDVNPLRDMGPNDVWEQFPNCSLLFRQIYPSFDRIDFPGNSLKSYYIDAGMSVKFTSAAERTMLCRPGGVREVPEARDDRDIAHDPFQADVFALAMTLANSGLTEILPSVGTLVDWMAVPTPELRPTARQVLAAFALLVHPRHSWYNMLRPSWYPDEQLNMQKTFWQRLMMRWRFIWHYTRVLFKAVILRKGHKIVSTEATLLADLEERYSLREALDSADPEMVYIVKGLLIGRTLQELAGTFGTDSQLEL